ncbi:variable surface protein [Plasmodium gonderi]|uniref:Variable surface protein n=1 Tax=Plasmodium gonderi TaxID=77519 RepID=A0A1Y1JU57_PLAGO|nr:variable surface protein [Plasmodium gonderi]GAW83933.1 variable surface protein [Plasmodium gonderi]
MNRMKKISTFFKIITFLFLIWIYIIYELCSICESLNKTCYLNGLYGIINERLLTMNEMDKDIKHSRIDEHNSNKKGNSKLKIETKSYSKSNQLKELKHSRNSEHKNFKINISSFKLLFKRPNIINNNKIIVAYNYIKNLKQRIDWDKEKRRRKWILRQIEFIISLFSLVMFVSVIPILCLSEWFSEGIPELTHAFKISAYYGAFSADIFIIFFNNILYINLYS